MSNHFQEFINAGWSDHATDAEAVAIKLKENLNLLDTTEKLPGYIALTIHVFGGHLGRWQEAKDLLLQMTNLESFQENQAVYRGLATLSFCLNEESEFAKYVDLSTDEGSLIRIYAVAASELTGQNDSIRASEAFQLALSKASDNLSKENPATRALAISGNNLACELEEKKDRNETDIELMILAAQAGRKYWELAGTWLEVERAEYRLAMTYMHIGQLDKALHHARLCESICDENDAAPFEKFFAAEALVKVQRARCVEYKSKVKEEYQSYCTIP